MAESIKIVNIRHRHFSFDEDELLQMASKTTFRYNFTAIAMYNKKQSGNTQPTVPQAEVFNGMRPFTLYSTGTPIAVLRRYMGETVKKEDLISARKAFRQLKQFATQCSERIIADLCTQIILREVQDHGYAEELLFFIERSASDKMLGRLASLNLCLDKVTICFLVFNPSDLMTIAMSTQTGKVHFDVNRLMRTSSSEYFGPYPGDFEDSLIQTYFHKPTPIPGDKGDYFPLRFDIFAQGLQRREVQKKIELVEKIYYPDSTDTWYDLPAKSTGPRLLVPIGFEDLKENLNKYKEEWNRGLLQG